MAQIVFINTEPEDKDFFCPKTGMLIREEPSDATVFLYNAESDTLQLEEELEPIWNAFEESEEDDFTKFVEQVENPNYVFFIIDAGDEDEQLNLAIIGIDMGSLLEEE